MATVSSTIVRPKFAGRDLSAPAVGEPVDHDDEAPGLHRRDVDLLALVDAVFGAHAQHLLQLPDERSGALELLGKRAVERLGARQIGARFRPRQEFVPSRS